MAMGPKLDVDLYQGLQEHGLTFKGLDPSGKVIAQDPNGEEYDIDVNEFLRSNNIDPSQVGSITYNTPSTALNEAPKDLSLLDRFKAKAVGDTHINSKGTLKYLKSKFEDVALDEENGIVVKEQGVWKRLDPSGWNQYFKDPWELSRDIADLGDILINAVGTSTGVAAGAPLGPAGMIAGAGAGGAIAGSIRTSLGRLLGTYEATPEEQMNDIALETILSLGGEGAILGAKPALKSLVKAARKIKKVGGEAASSTVSESLGATTGKGGSIYRTIIEDPEGYAARVKFYGNRAANTDDLINQVTRNQMKAAEDLLSDAADLLPRKWQEGLTKLADEVGDDTVSIDIKDIITGTVKHLEDNGFGKAKVAIQQIGSDEIRLIDLMDFLGQSPKAGLSIGKESVKVPRGAKLSVRLEPFDAFERAARFRDQLPLRRPPRNLLEDMNNILEELGDLTAIETKRILSGELPGVYKGKSAVRVLTDLKKYVNSIQKDNFKHNTPQALKEFAASMTEGFQNSTAKQFDNIGLGDKYRTLVAETYEPYGNAVNTARKILNSDRGLETLTRQITSAAGKNMSVKDDLVAPLIELTGKEGQQRLRNIIIDEAVKQTATWMPKWGFFNTPFSAAATYALGTKLLNPLIGLPAAVAFSPKAAGKAVSSTILGARSARQKIGAGSSFLRDKGVQYGLRALDFFRSRTPEQILQLLRNPELIKIPFREAIIAAGREDQDLQQLLQQGGVLPGGQQ